MPSGVETLWDGKRWKVVMFMDPEEAENVADALGYQDGAYAVLYDAAEEVRDINKEE